MPVRGPKVKVSRALNLPLTEKAARIMSKRSFGPGQHGQGRKRGPSVYKTQLVEKQRLKEIYNVSEKQLKKAFVRANATKGATGGALLQQLETRLDALVLRSGFAKTAYAARQYVAHGHFMVNGVRCFNGSMKIRVNDTISIREKSKAHPQIVESVSSSPEAPAYLEVNKSKIESKLVVIPERDQIPVQVTEQLIVEFYSK
jgi:small subunit ribosomal protein S4